MSERTERSEGREGMPGQQGMSERTERSEGREGMPRAALSTRRSAGVGRFAGPALRYLLLLLMTVLLVGPFLWQLSTALKSTGEPIYGPDTTLLPAHPTLGNFGKVTEVIPVWRYIGNSAIVAFASVVTNCLLGAMAGYALARMRFRGRGAVFAALLASLVVPFEVIMVNVFLTVRSLGLVDTLLGVLLPGAVSGLSILVMRTAFLALPRETEEAAAIDGAGEWARFWRVALPSVRGSLAVVGVFSFLFAWDDFLWPLIVLKNPDNFTLTVGLQYLSGTFTNDQRVVAAGTMIAVVPLLAVFFALQRMFFRGIGEGGVKG
ncbi:carbohydrate ABC transporter membrane protein 2, CUT1 family [Micromonospora sediminicola]|uniref:Carbohydrate ABC transporter membrane protein 2, CUT1 family n=2 Tax=Micromonospora sediminicola TaxID=946078 RepID=A0A1A9B927_9ACTN|nr:carbohydrate ABC transporter permease [Micromonospora sediminicola]SBT66020.1 carbohydrate ABC transporter membrane protein 2, CUT1 family [Micromonospora sediminicola]